MATLEELNGLCEAIVKGKRDKKEVEEQAAVIEGEIKQAEAKLMALLEENDMVKYSSPSGNFTIAQKESVTIPKDKESKEAFFKYLEERGIYWDFATVNSQKLNGFYREEREEFKKKVDSGIEDGFNFAIPGIGEPSIHKYFCVTRSK